MSEVAPLADHPAVAAWRAIDPHAKDPVDVEVLKNKRGTKVYRLKGVGPRHLDVIAKNGLHPSLNLEQTFYRKILPYCSFSSLACYGFVPNEMDGFSWLFLEDARGAPFDQMDRGHWRVAEEWLGVLHSSVLPEDAAAPLPRRDLETLHHYLLQARTFILDYLADAKLSSEHTLILQDTLLRLEQIALKWEDIRALEMQAPRSLVHGDLKLKNVRIRLVNAKLSLIPFDWEMGGWGASVIDSGSLVIEQLVARLERQGHALFLESPEKELTTYWSLMRQVPCYRREEDFRQLIYVGAVLRLIISTYWASQSLSSGWIARLMRKIQIYNQLFSELLAAIKQP